MRREDQVRRTEGMEPWRRALVYEHGLKAVLEAMDALPNLCNHPPAVAEWLDQRRIRRQEQMLRECNGHTAALAVRIERERQARIAALCAGVESLADRGARLVKGEHTGAVDRATLGGDNRIAVVGLGIVGKVDDREPHDAQLDLVASADLEPDAAAEPVHVLLVSPTAGADELVEEGRALVAPGADVGEGERERHGGDIELPSVGVESEEHKMGYDNNNWLRETAERQAAQLGGQPLFPPPPATHKTFLLDSDGRFASTRRLVTLKAPKRTIWERIKRFLLPMEMRKPSDRD